MAILLMCFFRHRFHTNEISWRKWMEWREKKFHNTQTKSNGTSVDTRRRPQVDVFVHFSLSLSPRKDFTFCNSVAWLTRQNSLQLHLKSAFMVYLYTNIETYETDNIVSRSIAGRNIIAIAAMSRVYLPFYLRKCESVWSTHVYYTTKARARYTLNNSLVVFRQHYVTSA